MILHCYLMIVVLQKKIKKYISGDEIFKCT